MEDYIRVEIKHNQSPSHSFHKSLSHKSLFLKPQLKLYPQFQNANSEKQKYMFWAGTEHRNLHHMSVSISRVTYFLLQAHTETDVSHNQHRKSSGEVFEKMQVNGPVEEKLARKKSLAVGVACMAVYIQTCRRLKRENL